MSSPTAYQPPAGPQYPQPQTKGMAVGALVLGILAILGCLIPLLNVFSLLLAIVSLVLGVIAVRRVKRDPVQFGGRGQALAGIVLSVLAVLGFVVSNALFGAAVNSAAEDPEVEAAVEELEQSAAPEPAPAEEQAVAPAEPSAPAEEPEAPAEEEAPAETAGVGTAVQVGDEWEYTVNEVECGVESVGADGFGQDAQGQFCLVQMSVTNIGNEEVTFFDDNVKLTNEAGQEYSADGTAAIYLEDNDTFLSGINPGNTLEGTVVFDIPADATPTTVVLSSGGLFGGGDTVEVAL